MPLPGACHQVSSCVEIVNWHDQSDDREAKSNTKLWYRVQQLLLCYGSVISAPKIRRANCVTKSLNSCYCKQKIVYLIASCKRNLLAPQTFYHPRPTPTKRKKDNDAVSVIVTGSLVCVKLLLFSSCELRECMSNCKEHLPSYGFSFQLKVHANTNISNDHLLVL